MKKIFVLVLMALALVACGSKSSSLNPTTTVCTNDTGFLIYDSGVQTYTADGDKVINMTTRNILDMGSKDAIDDTMIAKVDAELKEKNIYDGIRISYEIIDNQFIVDILDIDFTKASFDNLITLGIFPEAALKGAQYISLSQTVEEIETQGFTCVTE